MLPPQGPRTRARCPPVAPRGGAGRQQEAGAETPAEPSGRGARGGSGLRPAAPADAEPTGALVSAWTAGEAGGHLHVPALRAHGREAHRLHPGGQEPEEDGRGRPLGYARALLPAAGWQQRAGVCGAPAAHTGHRPRAPPRTPACQEGSPSGCGACGPGRQSPLSPRAPAPLSCLPGSPPCPGPPDQSPRTPCRGRRGRARGSPAAVPPEPARTWRAPPGQAGGPAAAGAGGRACGGGGLAAGLSLNPPEQPLALGLRLAGPAASPGLSVARGVASADPVLPVGFGFSSAGSGMAGEGRP